MQGHVNRFDTTPRTGNRVSARWNATNRAQRMTDGLPRGARANHPPPRDALSLARRDLHGWDSCNVALNAQERLEARRMLGRGHFAQIVGSAFQPAVLPSFHAPLLPRLDSILQLGSVDGDLTRTRSYQNFSRSLEIFGNHVMQVVRANDEDCPAVLNLILDRILDFSDDIVCDHWPTSLRLYFNAIIDQRRCKKAKVKKAIPTKALSLCIFFLDSPIFYKCRPATPALSQVSLSRRTLKVRNAARALTNT